MSSRLTFFGLIYILVIFALYFSNRGHVMAAEALPKVKVLTSPLDPMKRAVLIGRRETNQMIVQLELEASEPMWMKVKDKSSWGIHKPKPEERYHVELKLIDRKTKTRIPYADITFAALNKDTGKNLMMPLPPMWGNGGLHYSDNSTLLGNGPYDAIIRVDAPNFHREVKDKDLWTKTISVRFHFKLTNGHITEVTDSPTSIDF